MTIAYLVTGTTRGIGRALAEVILNDHDLLFTLSSETGRDENGWCNIQCDLSVPAAVVEGAGELVERMGRCKAGALVLINNAAVLDPVGPIAHLKVDRMVRHLHVNQAAPALLMSTFIARTAGFRGKRNIINVSSGAARNPYAGWSMYCAGKAALDMMTRCVAMEQENHEHAVSVCSVYPGKVDTAMQALIRNSDPLHFPAQPAFVRAREAGELAAPGTVARMIVDLYRLGRFQNGKIYDLRSARISGGKPSIDPISGQ